MDTIRFKGDSATRRRFYQAESFSHPAKMHIGMFLEMLHRYCPEPCTILDPMSGSGTVLLAAQYGHRVIANELEQHFVLPMIESWKKIQVNGPALGYSMGQAVILRGDARCLPLLSADCVIISPPYEHQDTSAHNGVLANTDGFLNKMGRAYGLDGDGHNATTNIGNLRNDAYWESMRQVYAEAWRVIKPGGIMALVLKGFTRDGQYVDLPGQTEAMLLEAGCVKHDEWRRELWSLSFWRILQKRRDPAAFDERLMYEEVLAFRKPECSVALR